MAFNPLAVLDEVTQEYRDYIQTEFRAKDLALRERLAAALERENFLCREPFFQAHRPFRAGKKWRDLPLDEKLARVMEERATRFGAKDPQHAYTHQSGAIDELLRPAPRSVVVTTGTGSGKTEAFLLPVLQNALADARAFDGRPGLTAILVYPMNALANDQRERIDEYLAAAGLGNAVKVEQYDRSSSQDDRARMRSTPPHILLTNYMMLEYLLVRPADRDAIFTNHRCRFLVLDEVHTYRGTLGANIAMLIRRLKAHLGAAPQVWNAQPTQERRSQRFPLLVPVATSATIKSIEEGADPAEARRQRDDAVRDFFGRLAGIEPAAEIQVFGEELQEQQIPPTAAYPAQPATGIQVDVNDPDSVRRALCRLAAVADSTAPTDAANRCRLLWDLNGWLIRAPLSVDQLIEKVRTEAPARATADLAAIRDELHTALLVGTALPDGVPGVLRIRAHRVFRGGWRFHQCLDPNCRHLQPMGEDVCAVCAHQTAPLLLCRSCGADYVVLESENPQDPTTALSPAVIARGSDQPGWLVYEPDRFDGQVNADDDDDGDDAGDAPDNGPAANGRGAGGRGRRGPAAGSAAAAGQGARPQVRGTREGRLNFGTLEFFDDPNAEGRHVVVSRNTKRCLCCGGSAGSHPVITRVEMGTSAAVKVLAEGIVESLHESNQGQQGYDGKDRLLIFADSRQDAAHQARFIRFTGRYDRMRGRVYALLRQHGALKMQRLTEQLGEAAVRTHDNPFLPADPNVAVRGETRERVRAWEEAPVLDQLSANANYRGTLVNLGLIQVRYSELDEHVHERGGALAHQLGVSTDQLVHVCRCVLDDMRTHSALSRQLLQYHPSFVGYPETLRASEWERSVKAPAGYMCDRDGRPTNLLDRDEVAYGITVRSIARSATNRGRAPAIQRIVAELVRRYGGAQVTPNEALAVVEFLRLAGFVQPVELFGFRSSHSLLQVNAEEVELLPTTDATRSRCGVCMRACAGAMNGAPCPACHGTIQPWPSAEFATSRAVRRVLEGAVVPLDAGEHTAQVPAAVRKELETDFKNKDESLNVLACSPTLEMGIDVGGLEAVAMRNIPPRPDNYAQRGGRAGRRARIGLVVSYANRRPHDQYFYDHPEEMIAGEVPTPTFSLLNRDVLLRHVAAIAFGAANPGLAGQMVAYVTVDGQVQQESVDGLKAAVTGTTEHTVELAQRALGVQLAAAGVDEAGLRAYLASLPERIQGVVDRTARQVLELRQSIERWAEGLQQGQRHLAIRAGDLINRLLGVRDTTAREGRDADDRSAGYPLRRFAEFGILPGYEFPTEPASLRLLSDEYEDDPITTDRRFGIGQFQPEAPVFARSKRWRVCGIDTSSPWNPQSEGPTWQYRVCRGCGLRHRVDHPRCPRCGDDSPAPNLPVVAYGGFVAVRNEAPVMQEEDRFAARDLVRVQPQWDGELVRRWTLADGWQLQLRRNETVDWLNEGPAPTQAELAATPAQCLHDDATGYTPCAHCGRLLNPAPANPGNRRGGRAQSDPFGHAASCPSRGQPPQRVAIATSGPAETLRLLVPLPAPPDGDTEWIESVHAWARSLGESLFAGLCHAFMIDDDELSFDVEGPWTREAGGAEGTFVSLTFTDPTVGGSGYLERIGGDLHIVAQHALAHLQHDGCETACYRCLKAYRNQRFHTILEWPLAVPALDAIAEAAPTSAPPGATDDPRPWLQAYAAGVGSPLELKFLRLFESRGLSLTKQHPVSVSGSAGPISIADFACPASRVAVYVDGASVHVGHRARRDRFIRSRLSTASPPWTVVELRAPDLARPEEVIDRLRTLCGTRGL